MRWTIAQVAGALLTQPGAGLDPVARVAGISIDSRTIRAGELFFAIHRVTMDTIIRAWPLSVARWRRLWRKKDWPDFRKRCEAAAFPWTTPSKRSRSLRARCGAAGTEKLQASRVPSG